MQLLETDARVPTKWSPRKCAFFIIVTAATLLAGIFVAGFFTGRSFATFSTLMSGSRNATDSAEDSPQPEHKSWHEAVCSFHRTKCPWSEAEGKSVVLLSLDGFRAEYLDRGLTPSLEALSNCGVTTPYMRSTYPTKTFPNHYTIVTGLYPESHGIIDNTIYDPILNHTFRIGTKEMYQSAWWIGEPVWETVQKQGKRSATYFWPGSDIEIHGVKPTFNTRYNKSIPFEDRIDQVLAWLLLPPEERPHLLTLYFEEPDSTGHKFGPNSPQIDVALARVDSMVNRLMTGLLTNGMLGCVNVIVVSDHGMSPVSCDRVIYLEELTSSQPLHTYIGREGAAPRIQPEPPLSPEELAGTIKELDCQRMNARFYDKKDLPRRYHYSNSRRIDQIVVDLQEGWLVFRSNNSAHYCEGGAHGYDNILEDMRAIFMATGPGLKQHYELQPFLNIEVYNLLCDLVGVEPSPNNGTRESLSSALSEPSSECKGPEHCKAPPHATFCQDSDDDPPDGCNALNIKTHSQENILENHAPWGVPVRLTGNEDCVVSNVEYLLGYNTGRDVASWASFSPNLNAVLNDNESWYHDGRAKVTDCHRFQTWEMRNASVEQTTLFPTAFASNPQAKYVTNAVPMYTAFKNGTMSFLSNKMRLWLARWDSLNVVVGPVWDHEADGLPDTRNMLDLPSHYFVVVTRCLRLGVHVEDCDEGSLDNLSFILPHIPALSPCTELEDHLLKHSASVRDVELITGLRFYSDMHNEHSLLLRLKLPEKLWPVLK